MNNTLKEESFKKIIENCIDKNGKEIDIDIILNSDIFTKSEYDDLKVFYKNSTAIKKIEKKENEINYKYSEIKDKINLLEIEIKVIENKMYPSEEDEINYNKKIKKLSELENILLRILRENKEKNKKNDSLFNKKLEEEINKENI